MSVDRSKILTALARLELPSGGDLVSNDFIRAVTIDGKSVRFVIEAPNPEIARKLAGIREAAETIVSQLSGVENVTAVLQPMTTKRHPQILKSAVTQSLKMGPSPFQA